MYLDAKKRAAGTFFCTLFCLVLGGHAAHTAVKTYDIQAAQPHKGINDTGEPRHIATDPCYQIKTEKADQAPIDGPDNCNCQCSVIQTF